MDIVHSENLEAAFVAIINFRDDEGKNMGLSPIRGDLNIPEGLIVRFIKEISEAYTFQIRD